MGKPTAEEMLGLHSRLMAADYDYLEQELSGRLEERLNSPEVNDQIRAAEEAVAEFKKNPQISNDPRLKALGETLPEMMETRMRAVTQAVAEKIKAEHPEYADQIQEIEGGEVLEEELAKATARLENYIEKDMINDVNKIVAAEVGEITADIHNVKDITRNQFQEKWAEAKAEIEQSVTREQIEMGQQYGKMQQMPHMGIAVKEMLKVVLDKHGPEYTQNVINEANKVVEEGNADKPEGSKAELINAEEILGKAPEVATPAGGGLTM